MQLAVDCAGFTAAGAGPRAAVAGLPRSDGRLPPATGVGVGGGVAAAICTGLRDGNVYPQLQWLEFRRPAEAQAWLRHIRKLSQ